MRTNSLLLFIVVFFVPVTLFSQEDILSRMQGLSQNGNRVYEISGNIITIVKEKAKLQEKDIKKIKKKYELKNIISEYSDAALKRQSLIIRSEYVSNKNFPDIKTYQLCYLLPQTEKEMDVVLFQSTNKPDSLLVQEFMRLYFSESLYRYTSSNWVANKIDFVGRSIKLVDACHWMFPHNVQCTGLGQMSWSIFETEKEARINSEIYMTVKNANSKNFKTLKSEDVNIVFEGEPTVAKRMVNKIYAGVPKFLMGGSSILVVYYVVQKVRGSYVSCILSHYTNNEDNYALAPLLKEVMSLDTEEK